MENWRKWIYLEDQTYPNSFYTFLWSIFFFLKWGHYRDLIYLDFGKAFDIMPHWELEEMQSGVWRNAEGDNGLCWERNTGLEKGYTQSQVD